MLSLIKSRVMIIDVLQNFEKKKKKESKTKRQKKRMIKIGMNRNEKKIPRLLS